MKPKLEKIKHYIEEEIVPHSPIIVSRLCITDMSPKKISKSNPVTESLFKPVNINRYQSVKKGQEVFYKPAYRIFTTK
jgi:hypothetical protein